MADDETGPVLPLYLNLRETQDLTLAVQIVMSLDVEILTNPEAAWSADMRDLGRADQVRAAARDRRPRLMSLDTALREHMTALAKGEGQVHHCPCPEDAPQGALWRCPECGLRWQLSVAQGTWIVVSERDAAFFRHLGFEF